MASKRKCNSDNASGSNKRVHRTHTYELKVEILKRVEKGEGHAEIARSLGMSRSTISTYVKQKEKILQHATISGNLIETINSPKRGVVILEMEKVLKLWVADHYQKHIPINEAMIRAKAKDLYDDLKERMDKISVDEPPFKASHGWFDRFKRRAGFHSLKLTGEAPSTNTNAASSYSDELCALIEEGGYCSRRVFNCDETGLFWKKMAGKTYLAKEDASGFKQSKDRLTLLLGGNAAGDFKLKPLLVYTSENPKACKGKTTSMMPVLWKSNPSAMVTASVFRNWFVFYFVPSVEKYCKDNNLPFKVLLILDSAPGHPLNLNEVNPNVKVVFLPPSTTTPPMDEIVIATFKRYYARRTMQQASAATDKEGGPSLKDFWRGYNIWNAVKNIEDSWAEVEQSTMNRSWKRLCPQFVIDFKGFDETSEQITREVVTLGTQLDLEMDEVDVDEIIAPHAEELTNEKLSKLQQSIETEKDVEGDIQVSPTKPKDLSLKDLREILWSFDNFINLIKEKDPNAERSSLVQSAVLNDIACYRILYEQKKEDAVQPKLYKFFKKIERPQPAEAASTSAERTSPSNSPVNSPSSSN